jgi:phosphoglycolate phosphatase
VHAVPPLEDGGVEVAGRTDAAIVRDLLAAAGVRGENFEARWAEVQAAAVEAFAELCPADLSGRVAPGVVDLLEALAPRDEFRLSLVTGNLEPVARLKLERAGLGRWFAAGQGGFGSDAGDRAELPALARRRAGALDGGAPYPRERTVVIGDTPRDIACARADGLRCVAVATGPYPAEELSDADAVARHARELPALVAAALRPPG